MMNRVNTVGYAPPRESWDSNAQQALAQQALAEKAFSGQDIGGPMLERLSERLQRLLGTTASTTSRVEAFGNRVLGAEPPASQSANGSCPRPEPATIEQQLSALVTALEFEADRLMAAAGRIERIG